MCWSYRHNSHYWGCGIFCVILALCSSFTVWLCVFIPSLITQPPHPPLFFNLCFVLTLIFIKFNYRFMFAPLFLYLSLALYSRFRYWHCCWWLCCCCCSCSSHCRGCRCCRVESVCDFIWMLQNFKNLRSFEKLPKKFNWTLRWGYSSVLLLLLAVVVILWPVFGQVQMAVDIISMLKQI